MSGCRPAVSNTSCCVHCMGWPDSLEGDEVPEATQTLGWLWEEGVGGWYVYWVGGWCRQLDGEGWHKGECVAGHTHGGMYMQACALLRHGWCPVYSVGLPEPRCMGGLHRASAACGVPYSQSTLVISRVLKHNSMGFVFRVRACARFGQRSSTWRCCISNISVSISWCKPRRPGQQAASDRCCESLTGAGPAFVLAWREPPARASLRPTAAGHILLHSMQAGSAGCQPSGQQRPLPFCSCWRHSCGWTGMCVPASRRLFAALILNARTGCCVV